MNQKQKLFICEGNSEVKYLKDLFLNHKQKIFKSFFIENVNVFSIKCFLGFNINQINKNEKKFKDKIKNFYKKYNYFSIILLKDSDVWGVNNKFEELENKINNEIRQNEYAAFNSRNKKIKKNKKIKFQIFNIKPNFEYFIAMHFEDYAFFYSSSGSIKNNDIFFKAKKLKWENFLKTKFKVERIKNIFTLSLIEKNNGNIENTKRQKDYFKILDVFK